MRFAKIAIAVLAVAISTGALAQAPRIVMEKNRLMLFEALQAFLDEQGKVY
jgi:uncharacterized membrane protein